MAEREDQPPAPPATAAAGLSADEAERLAEKFHPSWEADEATPKFAETPLAKPAEPRKPVKQTLIGGVSPFAAAQGDKPAAEPPAAAAAPATAETPPRPSSRPPKQPTLIGIAPPSDPPPPPLPKAKPKPKESELPSGPVTAGGSPDGPSGIAKVYKPTDLAAPPVVLTEEVAKAEAATNAELEARRRVQSSSRHMQTIMNIKAPEPLGAPPKRRSGLWQLLLGVAAGVVVVAAVFKLTAPDQHPAGPSVAAAVEAAPAPTAPAAVASSPMEPSVTPVEPAAGNDSRPVVLPAETASGDSVDAAAEPSEPAARRKSSKPATAEPAPKKAAPKPAKPVVKETASSPPASKGGVIVRDTPF